MVNFKTQAEQNEIPNERGLQKIKLNLVKSLNVKVLKIEVIEGYNNFEFKITEFDKINKINI